MARKLFTLTVPMVGGMLAIVAFNFADTYFVSKLGTDALAAMGFTLPVVMLLGGVSMGLGMGAASVISRAIGQGDFGRVRRVTTDSLILAAVAGVLTIDPVFRLMGAGPELLGLIRQYMLIWYGGIVFLVVPMVGNNAIRAGGDTVRPSLIMMTSAGLNVVLDPILIFGMFHLPAMGLRGAALATVISRALTLVAALAILHYNKRMLSWKRPTLGGMVRSWGQILHVGVPATATRMLFPLSMAAVTRMVAVFGPASVAAVGAAFRVQAVPLTAMWALGSVMLPFVGQNWGAGEVGRVDQARKAGSRFALGYGLLCMAALAALAGPVARLFSTDPKVIEGIRLFLYVVPISYGMRGVCVLAVAMFNGLGRPMVAAALNFVRMFVLYVPLAYLGSRIFHLAGVVGGVALADIIAGAISLAWMKLAAADAVARKSAGVAAEAKADWVAGGGTEG